MSFQSQAYNKYIKITLYIITENFVPLYNHNKPHDFNNKNNLLINIKLI